jgi:hypothetical protein
MKLYMFRTVPLSIIRSYSLDTQQWYMLYRFVDSFWGGSGWNRAKPFPSWSCSKAAYKPLWNIPLLSVQWITPDEGQRNCPKHVEFHLQNKFEKSVHLVGFIIRKSDQLVENFPTFCATGRLKSVFTWSHCAFQSWATWVQPSYFFKDILNIDRMWLGCQSVTPHFVR